MIIICFSFTPLNSRSSNLLGTSNTGSNAFDELSLVGLLASGLKNIDDSKNMVFHH